MRRILHLVTRTDPVAERIIASQRELRECEVRMQELMKESQVDYGRLLDQIFEADSIQVW